MKCVHHYVLKSGNTAVGQCKYCSEIRTFDNEFQSKRAWVNPVTKNAPPGVAVQMNRS